MVNDLTDYDSADRADQHTKKDLLGSHIKHGFAPKKCEW